jgi:transglutaminase-like putative cysteine protease
VVLLDEVTYTVTGPDDYLEHYRRAVKILRPDGRDEADFSVHFHQREKVVSLHAWSIDKSGHEYELKDKDFAERGLFDFELYNDIRLRTVTAPAADPGAVVAFEYEVRRHPWLNHFTWGFQESIPVHESHVVLHLPQGWEYRAYWAGMSPATPAQKTGNAVEWTLYDLPAIEHEAMSPTRWALSARLGLAYLEPGSSAKNTASWEALGRWYDQLTSGRRDPTRELSERARQLTAGKTDFDGRVRALASFLQSDIRYVAIEIGIGGYLPHLAQDIFRARYGDCKDKATLLSSMLHEVGIESDYVIISTYRGTVHPDLPSPVFNHMVLAIEVPPVTSTDLYRSVVMAKNGKRYLIFDPTDPYTPLGELRGDLQDSYALLVTDGHGELIHTPLLVADTNLLQRTGQFTLNADGVLAGEIVEHRSGDNAWQERAALIHANEQQRAQRIERGLSRSLKGFTLEKSDIQQLDQIQQPLVISMKLSEPGYGQVRGPLMLVRPRVFGEKSFALERKPRKYPFQFGRTSRETDTFEIELPKEYAVEDVPDPVKVDAGFASYQSKVEVEGSKIRYSREFVRREVLIGPERAEELRKFLGTIGADEAAVVVLKRAP